MLKCWELLELGYWYVAHSQWMICLIFDKFTQMSVPLRISYEFKIFSQFVSASQPLNALAFIFDGLHYGVSDFPYAAYSMVNLTIAK